MTANRYISFLLATCTFLCTLPNNVKAQSCPPNIDFESGSFSGWTCYTGYVASINNTNVINFNYSGGPVGNRHTMYASNPGAGLDEYGGFPKNCPNGSGYSIKLGNNSAGTEAEGVSYEFTIPANANTYNLIYNYAVVFQDPGHLESEQPRLDLIVRNLSDGMLIGCSSFSFFANGSPLPGFQLSPNPGGNTPVWFKRWTAVSINLDNLAGKTISLFFKTADCTFRVHFGYAYIDVNTECSDKFEGAAFCPDDNAVFVNAPYGYETYTWYNSTFTQVLGNAQTLTLIPPPTNGTTVAVVVVPYSGYGCRDTLYADLMDTLTYKAFAGPDKGICNNKIEQIGEPPKPGWNYTWTPAEGLNNQFIANPLANPDTTTTYYLTIRHSGGGCVSSDTVTVIAAKVLNTIEILGSTNWCIGSGDSTVLRVLPADSIQWFKDGIAIIGANQTELRVTQTGTYYATVFSFYGCVLTTVSQDVNISSIPVTGFTVNKPNQCQANNKFIFINSSTNAVGAMQYLWILGDGFFAFTRDLIYTYKIPGTYEVQLIVYSNSSCADTNSITINVYPNVLAAFQLKSACINLPVEFINNTIDPGTTTVNYLWNFGNGLSSNLRNPPPQVYNTVGNYVVSLSVNTAQCPTPLNIQRRFANIENPVPGKTMPDEIAIIQLPLKLQARPVGDQVLWTPANNLDNPISYKPTFIGSTAQRYIIELTSKSGCVTVDTQNVKINKNIEIYVPNSFTPNKDGLNDVLRPMMFGIKELNYFRVYNRWGQLIFETQDPKIGWDGRQKGTSSEIQTLVWVLEAIGQDNKTYHAKGTTVLLK